MKEKIIEEYRLQPNQELTRELLKAAGADDRIINEYFNTDRASNAYLTHASAFARLIEYPQKKGSRFLQTL